MRNNPEEIKIGTEKPEKIEKMAEGISKLSDEQNEKLQKYREIFDKTYQSIVRDVENSTLPDFYKDSSDKLDEIVKGVAEKSNDQELINNLIEAINSNREHLTDYLKGKKTLDYLGFIDSANLESEKVTAKGSRECIESIINKKVDYFETQTELSEVDTELTRMTGKLSTRPLLIQWRIARDFLKKVGKEENEIERLVYIALAQNALDNYRIMFQNLEIRKVLNINETFGGSFQSPEELEKSLKELEGEKRKKREAEEKEIEKAKKELKEIESKKSAEEREQKLKELRDRKDELLKEDEELDKEYQKIINSTGFKMKDKLFELKHGLDYQTARMYRGDLKPPISRISEIDKRKSEIKKELREINQQISK